MKPAAHPAPGNPAATFSHEINQPLTSILANAQAARRILSSGNADTGEILAIMDDIIQADKHAAELVRNLRESLGNFPDNKG